MPPNILFVLVDCLRADRLTGARSAVTPTLDGLVQRGALLPQVIASATSTTPCVGSLFTGLYPFAHGLRAHTGLKLAGGIPTLAARLAERGYHTYAEVTGPLAIETGLATGFQEYYCRDRREYLGGAWGERLLGRLRRKELAEPWFLFLHLWELHLPRRVPPGFNAGRYGATLYDRALSGLDAQIGELLRLLPEDTLIAVHGDHGEGLHESAWDRFLLRAWEPVKARLPAGAREAVYRRLSGVFRRGVRSDTFAGMGHGFEVHDYLLKVPLVLRGPGVPPGKVFPDQARQVDILPTLLDLAGGGTGEAGLHGRSLRPLLRGEALPPAPAYTEEHGTVLTDPPNGKFSLRRPPYKLVCRPSLDPTDALLFDLAADPDETHSIAAEQPALLQSMLAEVRQLQAAGRPAHALEPEEMSAEELELVNARLRDLGYLE